MKRSRKKSTTMHRFLLLIGGVFIVTLSLGQSYWDFENPNWWPDSVYLDETDTSNVWEIGTPQKTLFTSAYSIPNAIVTDLVDPYPINDTSSFYYMHIADGGFETGQLAELSGFYRVDSDSADHGDLFVSFDLGLNWISLFNDSIIPANWWWSNPPQFWGLSQGWQYFAINIAPLGPQNNIVIGDTVLYKFSFISDSVPSSRDGLMFDDFSYEDVAESLIELSFGSKKVIRVIDIIGRETEDKPNALLIYVFSDGTTEKVFRVE